MLVLLTISSVGLAMLAKLTQSQRHAVARVQQLGADLSYRFKYVEDVQWKQASQPPLQRWFTNLLGPEYNRTVSTVSFDDGSNPNDLDLAVLSHFRDLKQLTLMNRKRITDDGLVHLQPLRHLELLALNGTQITGPGLTHVVQNNRLRGLAMNDTPLEDEGLKHIGKLQSLEWLQLSRTNVTDTGLAYLRRLNNLRALELRGTAISDQGLEHLAVLSGLRKLRLYATQTTRQGRLRLQRRLPDCILAD